MKVGTLLFVIVFLMVASGFLFSENINTNNELSTLKAKIASTIEELEKVKSQLVACQEHNSQDAQTIRDLQNQVRVLETERKEQSTLLAKLSIERDNFQIQGQILDFLGSNPLLLIGALFTQFIASKLKSRKILGVQFAGMDIPSSDEYIRLSSEERAWLISKRRMIQSRRRNQ
jgi:hypothetical protein